MDIRLLRTFLTVVEHRAFGRAALASAMTQPALSKQIQALEAQVGGRLFHRGRHGATLTDLGTILLPEARDLVRRADALAVRMNRMARGEIGRLSVGFGLSSVELAPRAVAAFRRCYPDADIILDDMSSQAQLERLATGQLDVGFVRLPVGGEWGRLTLQTDRLAIATAGDSPDDPPPKNADVVAQWAAARPFVGLAQVRGPGLASQIEGLCTALGVHAEVVQEAHDLQTVLALVAAGVGTAFVPASADSIAPAQVVLTTVDHDAASWQIGAVWDRHARNPLTVNFLEVVREVAA
ncbi:LysR family transcriptional regulator [Actinomadura rudentiformis]|uniref:LysR family transcriptional regulator n=1 Tax=Actinomadura rudentiformis TaxID=359158 RepID=A0A6H9YL77_9ACTN|nr:LysR family transcriptional regulator [Actinomadura rudentiformis]KAB2347968.1 LysR family transcriptional regulator [Actinomadura rudentiformis]